MRRHLHFPTIFANALLLALCGGAVRAQDASKIIDQYVKAAGGSKALTKLQTVAIDGTFSGTGDAKPGTYSLPIKQPNPHYSEIRSAGKTFIDSYSGKSASH